MSVRSSVYAMDGMSRQWICMLSSPLFIAQGGGEAYTWVAPMVLMVYSGAVLATWRRRVACPSMVCHVGRESRVVVVAPAGGMAASVDDVAAANLRGLAFGG